MLSPFGVPPRAILAMQADHSNCKSGRLVAGLRNFDTNRTPLVRTLYCFSSVANNYFVILDSKKLETPPFLELSGIPPFEEESKFQE